MTFNIKGFFQAIRLIILIYPKTQLLLLQKQVHLFTDRSIYRPGQTIYFKGIITQNDKDGYKILTNENITVSFKDVNYQELKKSEFYQLTILFILPALSPAPYHRIYWVV